MIAISYGVRLRVARSTQMGTCQSLDPWNGQQIQALTLLFCIATDSESCRSYRNMRSLPLSQKLFRNAYVNVMRLTDRLVDGYYRLAVARPDSKFSKFVIGRKNVLNYIRRNIDIDSSRKTVWIHSSSFGEFAIARPLISTLADCNIVITFFSPSGYEPTSGSHKFKNTFYLPIDSASNASAFLDIVKPDIALFMVSELWLCYMEELKKRDIPALLISALIRDNSVFFKPYGALHRLMIKQFSHIFCLNGQSADCILATCCPTPASCIRSRPYTEPL